jgi:hypothetical protein
MPDDWLILHGGALGDLVLTIQLALRLPGVGESGTLQVVSRTNPGDLSACQPRIVRRSSEGLGLHWLFGDHDDPPPPLLRDLVRGARVLSALGGVHTIAHHRLAALAPAALYSLDPRPREGVARHITQQWQTQLEDQGLLVPKCIHQRPAQRGLGVPEELRQRGRELLNCRATVLIHPGSGGRGKCWPLAAFSEVARRLRGQPQVDVCFLVGPVEAETWARAELDALGAQFPVLHNPTPDELVAILAAARALVGNDAGPAHLAALLGTPTVTIFGSTPASVWRPLGSAAQVLAGDPAADGATWGIAPAEVAALAVKCM